MRRATSDSLNIPSCGCVGKAGRALPEKGNVAIWREGKATAVEPEGSGLWPYPKGRGGADCGTEERSGGLEPPGEGRAQGGH